MPGPRSRLLLSGLCALPLLAAAQAPAQAKDNLVIGIAQFPSSLHPDIDPEVVKEYADDFALQPITAYDPDWKNGCMLCTELPTTENGLAKIVDLPGGGKGMEVTIKLKPGLKWGDGQPVTAKDIAFTWKLAKDPASGFSNPHPWDRATGVDVVDDHTAVLHLGKVLSSYNEWDQILPEHVESKALDANGTAAGYLDHTGYNRSPTDPGLWDGPYVISAYQSGSQIEFQPNPNWSGTRPYFKRIVLRHIESTAALQANLLSGDVDMAAGESIGLTIDQVLGLRRQHPDQFTYVFKPGLTYEHIDLQRDNPILQDPRVRQAMLLAVDRQTLVQKLYEGLQPVAATWVNPLDQYYDGAIKPVGFDRARARQLLSEAGWAPGSDGICRKGSDRLSVEISTTAGNQLRELVEQVLQSQWKAACIEVTIKNEPARTLFGDTLKQRKYPGMVMYGWSSEVGESPRRTLASDQIPTAKNNWGGANWPAFSDPKMDADIAAADAELDPGKARAIWADMQRIYANALPVLPLYFRAEPHVVPKWLQGYTPTGQGDMSPLWVENWRAAD